MNREKTYHLICEYTFNLNKYYAILTLYSKYNPFTATLTATDMRYYTLYTELQFNRI